jgi:hypothetical protein
MERLLADQSLRGNDRFILSLLYAQAMASFVVSDRRNAGDVSASAHFRGVLPAIPQREGGASPISEYVFGDEDIDVARRGINAGFASL